MSVIIHGAKSQTLNLTVILASCIVVASRDRTPKKTSNDISIFELFFRFGIESLRLSPEQFRQTHIQCFLNAFSRDTKRFLVSIAKSASGSSRLSPVLGSSRGKMRRFFASLSTYESSSMIASLSRPRLLTRIVVPGLECGPWLGRSIMLRTA
jgi:hypothetical protein